MMYGSSASFALGMFFHALFVLALFFGFIAGVVWLARFANKEQVKHAFWTAILVGILGCGLTAALWAGRAWDDDSYGYGRMMDWYDEEDEDDVEDESSMEEIREEMMDLDSEEDAQ